MMKLHTIVLPLVFILAATVTTTGCQHKFNGKTTDLHHPAMSGSPTSQPDLNTRSFSPPESNPTATPTAISSPVPNLTGRISTSTNWGDLAAMQVDREKLAAYTVHFQYDSAVVQDREQANIASVAEWLKGDANAKLLVEGHCDERGTGGYNRSLGERRALAVREALARIGVDAARIRTISYGKDRPLDPGHDEAAWAKNRRGQFDWCTLKSPTP